MALFAGKRMPSLPALLGRLGYRTTVYSSTPETNEIDLVTYETVGFEQRVYPEQLAADAPDVDGTPATWQARRFRDELLARRRARAQIAQRQGSDDDQAEARDDNQFAQVLRPQPEAPLPGHRRADDGAEPFVDLQGVVEAMPAGREYMLFADAEGARRAGLWQANPAFSGRK